MAACNTLLMRLTSDAEVSISRKCTDDQPLSALALSTTPQRDKEFKRRRLTSEPAGGLVLRSNGELCTAADVALGATLGCSNPDETVMNRLRLWSTELTRLQPKVHVSEHLMRCGLCLFKNLRFIQWTAAIEGRLTPDYFNSPATNHHDLAACYWMALKHCSVRTAVPNRTLMSRATGCEPVQLGEGELAALLWLEWEVNAVLRLSGLVKDTEEEDK